MALELRVTGSYAARCVESPAYHVIERGVVVGRIHQSNDPSRWMWTVYTAQTSENAGGMAASFDDARSSFTQAWNAP